MLTYLSGWYYFKTFVREYVIIRRKLTVLICADKVPIPPIYRIYNVHQTCLLTESSSKLNAVGMNLLVDGTLNKKHVNQNRHQKHLLLYFLKYIYNQTRFHSAISYPVMVLLFPFKYCIEHVTTVRFYVTFVYSTRIRHSGVPDFTTDCPYKV